MDLQQITDTYYQCLSHVDYMREVEEPTLDDMIWQNVAHDYCKLYEVHYISSFEG